MSTELENIDFAITSKKQAIPMLRQVIEAVKSKQLAIYRFGVTVDLIAKQYQRQTMELKRTISALNHQEAELNAKVRQMERLQEQLKQHQEETESHLRQTQKFAAEQREIKVSREQRYHRVYSLPLISKQSKKKYIKARDQNLAAEQQLSEIRRELESCRQQIKDTVKLSAEQFNEQGQLSFQRRGSVDVLNNKKMHLEDLQKGCEYWSSFDTYQAQVILESAAYLLLLCQNKKFCTKQNGTGAGPLDVNQLWKKTFGRTCVEYNQHQAYGDKQWGLDKLRVQYECDACHLTFIGWPHVQQKTHLVCDQCTVSSSKTLICSIAPNHKMKRLLHTLFQAPKTYPL